MRLRAALLVSLGLLASGPAPAVNIEWVTVGDTGNACDPQPQGCFGSVPRVFRIGKYEVTNAQYAEFLNAVAAADPNRLYRTPMSSVSVGGITRSGSAGSYTYDTIAGRESRPIGNVSWYNMLRFANWLHNGQPTGMQDDTTTEDGAYTITEQGIQTNSVTRRAEASVFLPSEDEWYKAAYYDSVAMAYFDHPAGTDLQPVCAIPPAIANTANCDDVIEHPTDVGAYTSSPSPYGTFDQGGNFWEWNETIVSSWGRGVRGGDWDSSAVFLAASERSETSPTLWDDDIGFRVASVPEAEVGTSLLVVAGMLSLAAWRRHGNA